MRLLLETSLGVVFFRRALLVADPQLMGPDRRVAFALAGAGLAVILAQLLAAAGLVSELSLIYLLGLVRLLAGLLAVSSGGSSSCRRSSARPPDIARAS